jgi:hypothetical protein
VPLLLSSSNFLLSNRVFYTHFTRFAHHTRCSSLVVADLEVMMMSFNASFINAAGG